MLTKRKQRWVDRRKPDLILGTPLNPNAAVEWRYSARLEKLVKKMTEGVEKELRRLFEQEAAHEYFAQDASIASQARILTNAMTAKFNDMFAAASYPVAEQMVEAANKASSSSVHSSLQTLTGGFSLPTSALSPDMKQVLSASVTENVGLIKSISEQYLSGVQGAVMRSITTGRGMQDLVPYLAKHERITLRRARMVARDQSRKAYSALSRERMKRLGVKKFRWLHTGGSNEPRKLHQEMNGKIFSFDDPPEIDENTGQRGLPGDAINCRCRMQPVIDFEGDDDGK